MACSKCGSRKQPVKTIVVNESVEIIPEKITMESIMEEVKQPLPYTRQEVERAIQFLQGVTSGPDEKMFLYDFHNKHNKEQLKPSCALCIPRMQTRIYEMYRKLEEYERG